MCWADPSQCTCQEQGKQMVKKKTKSKDLSGKGVKNHKARSSFHSFCFCVFLGLL